MTQKSRGKRERLEATFAQQRGPGGAAGMDVVEVAEVVEEVVEEDDEEDDKKQKFDDT